MKIEIMGVEPFEGVFKVTVAGGDLKETVLMAASKDSLLAQLRRLRETQSDLEALKAMVGTTVEV